MSSTSETGHARNLANFETLIAHCTGFAADYNPGNPNISLPALQARLSEAQAAVHSLRVAKTAYDNATNTRETAFAALKPFSTRLLAALAASGAIPQTLADAKTHVAKIRGDRRGPRTKKPKSITAAGAPVPRSISTSQQSYDLLADHFAKLVQVLAAQTCYTPNEPELKVTTLHTRLTDLSAVIGNVMVCETAYQNTLITRNEVLYGPGTGLMALASVVKKYVKSPLRSHLPPIRRHPRPCLPPHTRLKHQREPLPLLPSFPVPVFHSPFFTPRFSLFAFHFPAHK